MPRVAGRLLLVAVPVLAMILLVARFRVTVVDGQSMAPGLSNGQVVIVDTAVRGAELRRGDVIVFTQGNESLVKRVAALPGDTLSPGEAAAFSEVRDLFERPPAGSAPSCLTVPAGRLVALGDNRRESDDSRAFGPVPLEAVVGRLVRQVAQDGPQ
ncbi:MAG: signal peptidase I [Armatimonadetes bacterium]|nr:signal peptidase I [Armatimonadota bacterium]